MHDMRLNFKLLVLSPCSWNEEHHNSIIASATTICHEGVQSMCHNIPDRKFGGKRPSAGILPKEKCGETLSILDASATTGGLIPEAYLKQAKC